MQNKYIIYIFNYLVEQKTELLVNSVIWCRISLQNMEDKLIAHGWFEVKSFIGVQEENWNCAPEFNSQNYVCNGTYSLWD